MKRFLLKDQGRDDRLVKAKDYSFLYFNLYLLKHIQKDKKRSIENKLGFVKIVKNNLYEFIDYRTHTMAEDQIETLKTLVFEISNVMADILHEAEKAGYTFPGPGKNECIETRYAETRDLHNYMDHEIVIIDELVDELERNKHGNIIHLSDTNLFNQEIIENRYDYYFNDYFFHDLSSVAIVPLREKNLIYARANTDAYINRLISTDNFDIELIHNRLYTEICRATFIFMTIYRIEEDSALLDYICRAAERGAEIHIYVELTARGNEESNIRIVQRLQDNNVRVYFHRDGYKVHAKVMICKSCTGEMFTHISTGNYTLSTGNRYSDLHYMTYDSKVYRGVTDMMNVLLNSNYDISREIVSRNDNAIIYFSPIDIKTVLLSYIQYTIDSTKHTKSAMGMDTEKMSGKRKAKILIRPRIWIKCNHIFDDEIVGKLEEAYACGVDVRLICRTTYQYADNEAMNRLPIRRMVGDMLEHDRLYIFGYDTSEIVFTGSADMISRKLSKRIEVLARIPATTDIIGYYLEKWQNSFPFYI